MCGIYGKLSSHQIDASSCRGSDGSPRAPRSGRAKQHWRTLLIVVPRLVSYVGFFRELCGALTAGGMEVHVACSPAPLGDEEVAAAADRVQLHHIEFARGTNPAAHLRAARALNRLVEMLRPDVVHAHFSAAIFTAALARTSRWPVTHATFHGVSFLATRGWKATLLRPMETWAACRLRYCLGPERSQSRWFASSGSARDRTKASGFRCRLRSRKVRARQRSRAHHDSHGNSESRASMLCSRFSAASLISKGSPDVVNAFLALSETNPDVRLLLIGAREPATPDRVKRAGGARVESLAACHRHWFSQRCRAMPARCGCAGFSESARGDARLRDGGAGARRSGDHV